MTLNLRPEIEHILKEKVKAGHYDSLEEAANGMILIAHGQEALVEEDIEELRREVALGIEQADRGQFSQFTAEEIIAQDKARRRR